MSETFEIGGVDVMWPAQKLRRDARKAAGTCINGGPKSRVKHGPVVKAGKCQRCIDVWERTK